jgi:hypothetical protein
VSFSRSVISEKVEVAFMVIRLIVRQIANSNHLDVILVSVGSREHDLDRTGLSLF